VTQVGIAKKFRADLADLPGPIARKAALWLMDYMVDPDDARFEAHRVERVVAEVVVQQLVAPDNQCALAEARFGRRRFARHGSPPVAMGRNGSVIQWLQEPTYSIASGKPAMVRASTAYAAVTPDPQ